MSEAPIRLEIVDGGLLDQVEERMLSIGGAQQGEGEQLEGFPLVHRFTPGMYIRQITMPAGAILTSKIHKTEHPFVVSKGKVSVYCEGGAVEHIEAPHTGVTKPGTRRLLVVHEETVWTTFHPTNTTDLVELERELLVKRENPLLNGGGETKCLS